MRPSSLFALALAVAGGVSCAGSGGAEIEPLAPQTVAVYETLRVPIVVEGGSTSMTFGMVGPDLERFDRAASVSGTGAGGEFRWTPLANHVGTHEVQIVLLDGSNEIDYETLVVTVNGASDSAPVFLAPSGAGSTFDVERDTEVRVMVDVRDEDSSDVELGVDGLPEGARFEILGPKQGELVWEPTPDQVEASQRWTIAFVANDFEHEPVEKAFIIVLRKGSRDDCPGTGPSISVSTPSEGERRPNEPGYSVVASVSDDVGLRDAPILYYSTTAPDDPSQPDVTEFEQVSFVGSGGSYSARIPSFDLEAGAEQPVWFLVSATDNDDDAGTTCDHQTDSDVGSFIALGGEAAGGLDTCAVCTRSTDCNSGVCATDSAGARCLAGCDGSSCSAGTCGSRTTVEGGTVQACGGVSTVCDGRPDSCTDDRYEPNDSISGAASAPDSLTDGQVCSGDSDFYRITSSSGTDLTVTVDGFVHSEGDLDLQLLNRTGMILTSSAGVTSTETVHYCVPAATEVFARVFGYLGAANHYSMRVARAAGSCCADDAREDDDTRSTARTVSGTVFDGTICPRDDDYVRFDVSSPTGVAITIVLDPGAGDLDLELYGPTGVLVASSRGTGDTETIDMDLFEIGTYTIRVLGYAGAQGEYLGELRFTSFSGCLRSSECTSGQVCDDGSCRDGRCTSSSECPTGHICPDPGPSGTSYCGQGCSVNADCKSSEACKWFPEGRYCGARGSGLNGGSCGTFADCGGQRACLDWPGGYCARAGCFSNSDCEAGTYCVESGGTYVCALDCWAADEICRLSAGYDCGVEYDTSGLLQFVCIP